MTGEALVLCDTGPHLTLLQPIYFREEKCIEKENRKFYAAKFRGGGSCCVTCGARLHGQESLGFDS